MIPIFNIFWIIIFNSALNKSIEAEIQHKQLNFRFLGITGILYPFVIYGTLLSYIVLEISGITNSSESISELTLITVIFSAMAIIWGWLYYFVEIASFNKMNTESEETNYRKIAVYIIVIVSVLLTLVLSYNYWNNYTIQQDYERSQN
jgi:mannose/fructose/N-acetylgalactosamine-specific phosphotransferase system component IIC